MKKIISLIILGCMVPTLSSCSSDKVSSDDERLTHIRRDDGEEGEVYYDPIRLHCKNVVHNDDFSTIEISPEIKIGSEYDDEIGLRIWHVFSENKFLAYSDADRVVGILSDDGTFDELFAWDKDSYISLVYCDDDYIVYNSYKYEDISAKSLYLYSLSERTGSKIAEDTDIVSLWVFVDAVRIDDTIYYNIVDDLDENLHTIESIMAYNISDRTNKLICKKATLPSKYNDKLAFVKDNTAIVQYTDEGVSEILDLKQSGLYRAINGLHISGDKICYNYPLHDFEGDPELVTGTGVGFIKDGKRYDFADSDARMNSLSFGGNLAAWDYGYYGEILPIVYDSEKDTAIVLDAEREKYQSFAFDNTVCFVAYPPNSEKIKIVVYNAD